MAAGSAVFVVFLSLSLIKCKQLLGKRQKQWLFHVSLEIPRWMTVIAVVTHAQSDYFNILLNITDKDTSTGALIG